MNPFLLFFLFLIIVALILIGVVYLAYRIPKRMGKRKLGVILSSFLAVGFTLIVLSIVFDDYLFFKSDAREYLNEPNIELKDDFKILSNESGGFMDYYHRFELEISEDDKSRIINHIKSQDNYIDSVGEYIYLPNRATSRSEGDTLTANYHTKWKYKTEIYYPNGKGYTPTYKIISISKSENKLIFEHILD